jgi:hypothetical protein
MASVYYSQVATNCQIGLSSHQKVIRLEYPRGGRI